MKKLIPILIIAGTLLIGFILGFFVSTYITNHKITTVMQCANTGGLEKMIYNRINASDEQIKQLNPILNKYSEKSTSCLNRNKEIIDSLSIELKPYLTPEQIQKLNMCIGCNKFNQRSCSKKNKHKME